MNLSLLCSLLVYYCGRVHRQYNSMNGVHTHICSLCWATGPVGHHQSSAQESSAEWSGLYAMGQVWTHHNTDYRAGRVKYV